MPITTDCRTAPTRTPTRSTRCRPHRFRSGCALVLHRAALIVDVGVSHDEHRDR
jgi:hypothetical protein